MHHAPVGLHRVPAHQQQRQDESWQVRCLPGAIKPPCNNGDGRARDARQSEQPLMRRQHQSTEHSIACQRQLAAGSKQLWGSAKQ